MINKLPPWIEVGGFCLTLTAGAVNAIALLGFKHQGVSHLTGISTLLGIEIANRDWAEIGFAMLVMLGFIVGAALSSFIVGGESLKLGKHYGFTLALESLLLLAAIAFLSLDSNFGHVLACMACGLQNAMTSTYSGAVVRTTHVSGLFTDIGIQIGLKFRGNAIDKRRVQLYSILICGFILGGALGAVGYRHFKYIALLMPALIALCMAIAYGLLARRLG